VRHRLGSSRAASASGLELLGTVTVRRSRPRILSTDVVGRRYGSHTGGVGRVGSVTSSVTGCGDAQLAASVKVVLWEGQIAQAVRGLDNGGSETHLDVPLDVAMEEPDAGVGGIEADDGMRVWHDGHGVAARRGAGVAAVRARPVARAAGRTGQDLEVMTVQVERVRCGIDVIDDDLDDIAVIDDEGVDLAVDIWVGVVVTRGCRTVERRHLLPDVG